MRFVTKILTIMVSVLLAATVCSSCSQNMGDAKSAVSLSIGNKIAEIRKAVESGDVNAQFHLGGIYAKGEGVEQNLEQSVFWCRKSAEQGHTNAQLLMGSAYYHGQGAKDYSQAFAWYKKVAEKGYATAQGYIGSMYANGIGLEKAYGQAVEWSRKAAEQGGWLAQFNLGLAYYKGQGVDKDLVQSLKWLSILAKSGDKTVVKKLDEIESQMTAAQINQARALAAARKPGRNRDG